MSKMFPESDNVPANFYGSRKGPNSYQRHRTYLLSVDPHCYLCRKHLTEKTATLDHVIPRSKKGTNDKKNLKLCCKTCNTAKADTLPGNYEHPLTFDQQWMNDYYGNQE